MKKVIYKAEVKIYKDMLVLTIFETKLSKPEIIDTNLIVIEEKRKEIRVQKGVNKDGLDVYKPEVITVEGIRFGMGRLNNHWNTALHEDKNDLEPDDDRIIEMSYSLFDQTGAELKYYKLVKIKYVPESFEIKF